MRIRSGLAVLLFVLTVATSGYAQETAAESVEKLKLQLLDVQDKEEVLRARLEQLDENLKPENIERSLAGVGSTKPEALREARRRQLATERDGVLAQLKLVETSRVRLETALANAEAKAYQQSARPAPTAANDIMIVSGGLRSQWLMFGGGGLALLALSGGALMYRRMKRIKPH